MPGLLYEYLERGGYISANHLIAHGRGSPRTSGRLLGPLYEVPELGSPRSH